MNLGTYHTYYNTIPLPIFIVDPHGAIIYHNNQGAIIFSQYYDPSASNVCNYWRTTNKKQLSEYLTDALLASKEETIDITLLSPYSKPKQRVRLSNLGQNQILFICMEMHGAIHSEENKEEDIVSIRNQLEVLKQKHDSLIHENPDGIVIVDQKGKITNINQSLQRMIGYTTEEVHHTYEEHIPEEELAKIRHYINKALTGKAKVYETCIPHKNGWLVHLQIKTIPIKVDHSLIGVYMIVKDISDYKNAQKEAQDREEQLRSLINSMPEFVVFKDQSGRLLEMNQFAKDIFGLEDDDYKGKKSEEIESINSDFKRLLSVNTVTDYVAWDQKKKIQYEYKHLKENGEEFTFEIVKAPGFTINGKQKYIIALGRDISLRKEVEEELNSTKKLLESIITNSADAISIINLEKKIIQTNPAFQRLFGYSNSNKELHQEDLFPEDKIQEAKEIFDTVLNGKDVIDFVSIRKRKDGTLVDVSVTYSPIKDQEGNITAFSAITRDIRDRKKTDELLMRSEKLSVVGQLAATVAHEVRNPLTAVKGFIQLYKNKINEEILLLMLSELDRIEGITTEFLSLAKPQAVTYQQTDVVSIIKNTIFIMGSQALMNKVEIKSDFYQNTQLVYCEKNQITQVLLNIIKNGIEAMPNGGPLTVSTNTNLTHLIIEVSDQGIGMPEKSLKRLGEPFYSKKEKGTGLGLVVCFKIIQEHKGHIEFNSKDGKGTTVTISLPLNPHHKDN